VYSWMHKFSNNCEAKVEPAERTSKNSNNLVNLVTSGNCFFDFFVSLSRKPPFFTRFFQMKQRSFQLLSLLVLMAASFLSIACFQFREYPQQKPVSLFNGKNLDGWKIYGTEKWYVEKGELVCESGPDKQYGYLGTEKPYQDFELTLEFKQEANGNSGVFFRSSIEGTKISGWQTEVAPLNHDTGGIYESYGRGWLQQIPEEKEHYLKVGDWNKLKIRVVGPQVTTWLNGHEMVNFSDEKIGAASGVIALQIHDGGGIKVRWRNILVEELK
jgi:hypothetical protein